MVAVAVGPSSFVWGASSGPTSQILHPEMGLVWSLTTLQVDFSSKGSSSVSWRTGKEQDFQCTNETLNANK